MTQSLWEIYLSNRSSSLIDGKLPGTLCFASSASSFINNWQDTSWICKKIVKWQKLEIKKYQIRIWKLIDLICLTFTLVEASSRTPVSGCRPELPYFVSSFVSSFMLNWEHSIFSETWKLNTAADFFHNCVRVAALVISLAKYDSFHFYRRRPGEA